MKTEQFRDMAPSEWQASIDVNLYGVMNCCHAVVNAMCKQGWGRIITISSAAGTHGAVAAACVWLASEEAAWVTGQTIGINGGSITS